MRIKTWTLLLSMICIYCVSFAQKGYDISVTFKQPINDKEIYLAKYYAKPIPNQIYMVDTATADNKGKFHFKHNEEFIGGVYLIIFNNKAKWLEVIVDNGIKMSVNIDTADLINGTTFTGSKDNELNKNYQIAAAKFNKELTQYRQQLATASSKDSSTVQSKMQSLSENFIAERKKLIDKNPNTFFSTILKAIDRPVVPPGPHYLEDGKTVDSFYAYKYTKMHYWDKFDFTDDRLIHTPIYDGKLNDYLDNYIFPSADSLNHEIDFLASRAKASPELYKYTLHMLGNYTRSGKRMNLDESFIHLVENYYMKGEATWLDSTQLHQYYLEPARKMKPIVLGNVGPDIKVNDAFTLAPKTLHQLDAEYSILVFWDITCGHCKEEVPSIDSTFRALKLEQYGAKIFSIAIGPEGTTLQDIQRTIEELKVKNPLWNHHIITDPSQDIREMYNFITTPQVFILDKEKKIIAKMINHTAIEKVLQYHSKDKNN